MGFALCCGIFCALLTSLIRSSTVVHSLISLLAKRKISAHHFAKSSSMMPGIFLFTRSDLALTERTLQSSPLGSSTPVHSPCGLLGDDFVCRVLVVRRKRTHSPAAQGAAVHAISKDGTRGGGISALLGSASDRVVFRLTAV